MKNKAFTLIELLVTIAIISLLTSIVFASVSSARDKANIKKAQAQGSEIGKAIELSRLSNGSIPFSNTDSGVSIKDDVNILNKLRPYYSSIDDLSLPNDSNFSGEDYYIFTEDDEAKVYSSSEGRDLLLKCEKDYFEEGSPYNNSEGDYEAWRTFTDSWEPDDSVVTYKKYRDYSGFCMGVLSPGPEGHSNREKLENQNILYFYNDLDIPSVPAYWQVYNPTCSTVWACQ